VARDLAAILEGLPGEGLEVLLYEELVGPLVELYVGAEVGLAEGAGVSELLRPGLQSLVGDHFRDLLIASNLHEVLEPVLEREVGELVAIEIDRGLLQNNIHSRCICSRNTLGDMDFTLLNGGLLQLKNFAEDLQRLQQGINGEVALANLDCNGLTQDVLHNFIVFFILWVASDS